MVIKEKDRQEKNIQQIGMEWQKIARTGFEESRELLQRGFGGDAGEIYQKRLKNVLVSVEKTANHLWEGMKS